MTKVPALISYGNTKFEFKKIKINSFLLYRSALKLKSVGLVFSIFNFFLLTKLLRQGNQVMKKITYFNLALTTLSFLNVENVWIL